MNIDEHPSVYRRFPDSHLNRQANLVPPLKEIESSEFSIRAGTREISSLSSVLLSVFILSWVVPKALHYLVPWYLSAFNLPYILSPQLSWLSYSSNTPNMLSALQGGPLWLPYWKHYPAPASSFSLFALFSFKEVITVKWDQMGGTLSIMTDVLLRKGRNTQNAQA